MVRESIHTNFAIGLAPKRCYFVDGNNKTIRILRAALQIENRNSVISAPWRRDGIVWRDIGQLIRAISGQRNRLRSPKTGRLMMTVPAACASEVVDDDVRPKGANH